jgi:cytochrome c-type biogenesis protein CcmH/NrfF
MYDGVYSAMIKAGVVIETPKERMYGSNGERAVDELLMDGRTTKFQLFLWMKPVVMVTLVVNFLCCCLRQLTPVLKAHAQIFILVCCALTTPREIR